MQRSIARVLFSTLLPALLSLVTTDAFAQHGAQLRILSYNIHHGEGMDRRIDLQRIADVILSVKPDLVALQEVDQGTARSMGVMQSDELGRLTGMHATFGRNLEYLGGGYGNTILSQFRPESSRHELLPRLGDNEQRGLLLITVLPRGIPEPVLFVCTHLDYQRDDTERLSAVNRLRELIPAVHTGPAILAGDLNDITSSRTLQQLLQDWKSASDEEMPTIPVDRPQRQIDYILYQPAPAWQVVEARVLDEAVASDHRAIFAVLEYRPRPAEIESWKLTRELPAPEAHQAACADDRFLYAVTNTHVARYDRDTGQRLAVSSGEAFHLNSGFVHNGQIFCAHSNYPQQPEQSDIRLLDPATMQLSVYRDFGNYGGSLTWVVFHDQHWWCNFARYGEDNGQTFLVQFDSDWNESGRWTWPEELIGRLGRYSLSGGLFLGDELLVTDHDNPVLYRVSTPQPGVPLQLKGTVPAPFTGQGIAADPVTGGLVGIHRASHHIVLATPVMKAP